MIRPDPEPKPNTTRVTWGCNPVLSGRGLLANLQKSLFCLIPGRNPTSLPALSVLLLRLLSWRDAESLNLALQTYISSLFNKTNYALFHICQFFDSRKAAGLFITVSCAPTTWWPSPHGNTISHNCTLPPSLSEGSDPQRHRCL